MAISGSGNSPKRAARHRVPNDAGCKTIALTGRDGGTRPLAQLNIQVPCRTWGVSRMLTSSFAIDLLLLMENS